MTDIALPNTNIRIHYEDEEKALTINIMCQDLMTTWSLYYFLCNLGHIYHRRAKIGRWDTLSTGKVTNTFN